MAAHQQHGPHAVGGRFLTLNMSDAFKDMFFVVIQLGAILAVVILFWQKMFPFQFKDKSKPVVKMDTISLWLKVVVACIPGAIVTLLFDDYIEAHLHTPLEIALMLFFTASPLSGWKNGIGTVSRRWLVWRTSPIAQR